MDLAASHLGFVAASYALSAILILGLTIRILARDRKHRAEVDRLDRQRRKGDA